MLQVVEERHREEGVVLLAVDTDDPSASSKIPEFLKKRGIHAKVLLGGPQEPQGYETHPGAIYVIDRQGILAGVPGDDYTDDLGKGMEARLPDLLAGKPTQGPLLWTVEKAPPHFGLLWKEPLESGAEALAIAPPSKDHPAEIGVATGSHLVRYSASGSLLGDAPLEAAGLQFLGGADLDGDGTNEWIMAQGNAVTVMDAAGEEYWMHIATEGLVQVDGVMDLNQDGSREIVLHDDVSIVARKALPGILWRTPALDSLQSVVPDPSGVLLAQTRGGIRALDANGLLRGMPLKVRDGEILKGRIAQEEGGTLDVFGGDDTAVDIRHDLDGDGRNDILVSSKGVVAVYTQDGSPLLVLAITNNWGKLRVAMDNLDGRPGDELVMAVPEYGLVALGISPQTTKP